jgi:hypothetical protein
MLHATTYMEGCVGSALTSSCCKPNRFCSVQFLLYACRRCLCSSIRYQRVASMPGDFVDDGARQCMVALPHLIFEEASPVCN